MCVCVCVKWRCWFHQKIVVGYREITILFMVLLWGLRLYWFQWSIPFGNLGIKGCNFSTQTMADLSTQGGVVDVPLAQTGEGIAECELLKWFVQEVGDDPFLLVLMFRWQVNCMILSLTCSTALLRSLQLAVLLLLFVSVVLCHRNTWCYCVIVSV